MALSMATPEQRGEEWGAAGTPGAQSTGSEYSPSVASVRTAVRLEAGQARVLVEAEMPSFRPQLSSRVERSPPMSPGGQSLLSPPLKAISVNRPRGEANEAAFGDAEVDDRKLSIYGGPKVQLISPPPWMADERQKSRTSHDGGHSVEHAPLPRAGTPTSTKISNKGSALPPGLQTPVSPRDLDVSFLDLAGNGRTTSGPLKSGAAKEKKTPASTTTRARSPSTPLPKVNGSTPPVRRPPLPPAKSAASLATSASYSPTTDLSSPSTPATSLSASSPAGTGHAILNSPKPPPNSLHLISLDQARLREQERNKAATEDRRSPSPIEASLPPAPKLRNKKSGFMRIFKRSDDEASMPVSPSLPTPPLSVHTGSSLDESPTSILSGGSAPVIVSPPRSAPATTISFRDVASTSAPAPRGNFRDKGLAPTLSLRPVSMAISGIPTTFLAEPAQLEPPSPKSEPATSPSVASFPSHTSGASELTAVDEQIATAKAAWQRQITELEEQVRALQHEVDVLRPVAPATGWKECDACGCTCGARRQANSIMHRQRQKLDGDGGRSTLFASRHF